MRFRSTVGGVVVVACALVAAVGTAPASGSASDDGSGFVPAAGPGRTLPEGTWLPWTPGPSGSTAEPESVEAEIGPQEGITAGDLDSTLANDGTLTPNFVNGPEDAASVAIQPDGKIVVGGAANGRLQVARFNPDGTRDTSFGGGDGAVQQDITPGPDWIEDIALQADGAIVAVGSANGSSVIARYTSSGSPDGSFGTSGHATSKFGRGFNVASAVVVDGVGRIVYAGRAGGGGGRMVVGRLDQDGDRDLSFASRGRELIDPTGGDDFAWDLAMQPDGKLVVVGGSVGATAHLLVVRLAANGGGDLSFRGGSRRITPPGGGLATSVVVQADGSLVVGGIGAGHGGEMLVLRLTSTGGFDDGFGWRTVDFSSASDYVWRIALHGDGGIVAVGRAGGAGGRFAVARLASTGALDPAFSGDGKLTTNLTPGDDQAHSVALDADGDIVATGVADGASTAARIAIVRYLGA